MQIRSRTAATPIAFVRAILLAYEKYGVDYRDALADAEIATDLLKKNASAPYRQADGNDRRHGNAPTR